MSKGKFLILSVIVCLVLVLSQLLVACSSTPTTTAPAPTTSSAPTTTTAPATTPKTSAPASTTAAPTTSSAPTTTAAPTTSAPAVKAKELKLGHTWPAGSFMDVVFNKWAEKIKTDSGGKLTVRVYPGATLATAPGTYKAVTDGVMDIGAAYRYGAPGSEFVTSLSTMFAGIPDPRTGTKVLDDVRVQFAEAFNKEWQDNKLLWIIAESGANIVTVDKPITQMSDLKGLQLRVPTAQTAEVIKNLGGTSVTMPLTDLTTALQKNTVNGCTMQFYSLKVYKIADLTKYVLQMPLYAPPDYAVTMNWKTYNSLSPDLQKVIDDSLAWGKEETLKAYEQADIDGKAYGESLGLKFSTLSPEEKARWFLVIDTVLKNQAAALDAKGYPDTALLNFVKQDIAKYVK